MQKSEPTLREYLAIIFRRIWLIIISISIGIVFGLMIDLQQKPTFTSRVTLEFKSDNFSGNILGRPVFRLESSIKTAVKVIQSRRVAKEALTILSDPVELGRISKDEYIKIYTPEQIEKVIVPYFLVDRNLPPEAQAREILAKADMIRGSIAVSRDQQTNYIVIDGALTSGVSLPPEKAGVIVSAICNAVAVAYQRVEANERVKTGNRMKNYVEREIAQAGREWRISTEQLNLFQKHVEITNKLDEIAQDKQNFARLLTRLRAILNKPDKIGYVHTGDPAIDQELNLKRLRFEDASKKLNSLLELYTEYHPQVQAAQAQMEKARSDFFDSLQGQIIELEYKISSLIDREDGLYRDLDMVTERLDKAALEEPLLAKALNEFRLQKSSTLWRLLNEKLQSTRLVSDESAPSVAIVDIAEIGRPQGMLSRKIILSVGGIIGFVLGLAFAFLVESLDTSLATVEEVEQLLEIPVLGVIPKIEIADLPSEIRSGSSDDNPFSPTLVSFYDPKSITAESYRTLRTNLQFMGFQNRYKTLTVTSSGPQEGKTTTLGNLGIVMANMGHKTLIVNSNLRRPALHRLFGFQRDPGLVNYLAGGAGWEELVIQSGIPNLNFISSGPIPHNPAELIASPRMDRFISEAKEEFDIVLFDSSPILPVTDGSILASKTDGVLLVYLYKRAAREAIVRARELLTNVGANIWGICLNFMQAKGELGPTYYYYQASYYGENEPDDEFSFQYYSEPKKD